MFIKKLSLVTFTKEGYENLKKEYQEIFDSRKDAIKELSRAREMGDLSENGFYKAAKGKVISIDSSLRHLHNLIRRAKVAGNTTGAIGIGSKVTVNDGKTTQEFIIVGRYEANPSKGRISDASPIGRSLIGRKIGDIVKINTPNGEKTYKILKA